MLLVRFENEIDRVEVVVESGGELKTVIYNKVNGGYIFDGTFSKNEVMTFIETFESEVIHLDFEM